MRTETAKLFFLKQPQTAHVLAIADLLSAFSLRSARFFLDRHIVGLQPRELIANGPGRRPSVQIEPRDRSCRCEPASALRHPKSTLERSEICAYCRFVAPVILVADDDDDFGVLLPHSLRKANVTVTLRFVLDGGEAINYLTGKGRYSDRANYPLPHVLLLDLKMPRINGFDVLAWKRAHPEFDSLPVVVWSSSDLQQDKLKAMSLGAVYYVCKPERYDELPDIIRALKKFCAEKE